ncbi:MAG: D-glycero-beta-D-manno-heptose-7-phosphate kinase [Verrucomicrobiota bacterium]
MRLFSKIRLQNIIRKIQSTRILVIGDVMLDQFIWGKVSRISPEAPVPVVHVTSESSYPGGASNVARSLADFSVTTSIAGVIGQDTGGNELLDILHKSNIQSDLLQIERDYATIKKTRIVARQQQVVRVDREEKLQLSPEKEEKFLNAIEDKIDSFDAIILEDYGKGLFTQSIADALIKLANQHSKIITVDPNPNNPLSWRGATLIKPNRIEAYSAAGHPLAEDEESLVKVGSMLLDLWQMDHLLITLGEQGMMLFHKSGKTYHTPTRAREVFDVSGAGDTAIAFLTASIAAGLKLEEAAEISNHAAGVVVAKLGTATLMPEELIEHILDEEVSNQKKRR